MYAARPQLPHGHCRRPVSSAAYGSHHHQLHSQGGSVDHRHGNLFGNRHITTMHSQDATRQFQSSSIGPSIFAAPWAPAGGSRSATGKAQDGMAFPVSNRGLQSLVTTFPPKSSQQRRAEPYGLLPLASGHAFPRAHTAYALPNLQGLGQLRLQPPPTPQPAGSRTPGFTPPRARSKLPTPPPTPGPPAGMATGGRSLQGTYPGKAANQDDLSLQAVIPWGPKDAA